MFITSIIEIRITYMQPTFSTEVYHSPSILIFAWNCKGSSYILTYPIPTHSFKSLITKNQHPLLILSKTPSKSFPHSLVLSFSHSRIPSFSHFLILSFSYSLIPPFSHSLIPLFLRSLILSFSHSLILSC